MKKRKVFVLYRVVQQWRAPIFERMAMSERYQFKVVHGPDFPGTKVVNTKAKYRFDRKELFSFRIQKKSVNGLIAMPFSPFLFFYLCFKQPHVIVTEGASNLVNAFQGFCYCKIFRRKFIWWSLGKIQKRDYDVSRKRIDWIIRYMERKSDAIISYSTLGKQYFESLGIPSEKIFVAVNVVDTIQKTKQLEHINSEAVRNEFHNEASFNVLFVGAINKEKKIDVLLRAFAVLEKKYPDIYLNIVGDGSYLNDLKAIARELEIRNINFRGSVIDGVEKYFIGSDVFVLPGLGGLAVSEAMVYGLPVIASIGDGCEADLIDKTNGFLDPDLAEDSLGEYLETLYLDRKKLDQFKASSLYKIRHKFNVENYLEQVYKAIDSPF